MDLRLPCCAVRALIALIAAIFRKVCSAGPVIAEERRGSPEGLMDSRDPEAFDLAREEGTNFSPPVEEPTGYCGA